MWFQATAVYTDKQLNLYYILKECVTGSQSNGQESQQVGSVDPSPIIVAHSGGNRIGRGLRSGEHLGEWGPHSGCDTGTDRVEI